jgi:hypothetical protein
LKRLAAAGVIAVLALPCFAAKLHIEVDDEHGAPVWTRLEVRNRAGEMFQPAAAS